MSSSSFKLYNRILEALLLKRLIKYQKVVVLFGARQIGKTTLIKQLVNKLNLRYQLYTGDDHDLKEFFSPPRLKRIKELIGQAELLIIDEAQQIPNIGLGIKLLHDNVPNLRILLTGSSSFQLARQTKEPLTGRQFSHMLYPLSLRELNQFQSPFELRTHLEDYLIYGMYPEIHQLQDVAPKKELLYELVSSQLYKDILELSQVQHANKVHKLLQLIALQIGQLVSIHELSQQLSLSVETVERYIYLLEEAFILLRLRAYSKNPRKEISKKSKIYFYDTGIRNAVIKNFNPLSLRQDKGSLWENWVIMERIKQHAYNQETTQYYFWRSYAGAEIDLIEEQNQSLRLFEIKFKNKHIRLPKHWQSQDHESFQQISSENFLDFLI